MDKNKNCHNKNKCPIKRQEIFFSFKNSELFVACLQYTFKHLYSFLKNGLFEF